MMEKLADAILKHSKLIIILWVILLLVAAPFVYMYITDPSKVVKYEMTSMEGANSESNTGNKILKDNNYFTAQTTDYVVVFTYDPQKQSADDIKKNFIKPLEDKIQDHWKDKGTTVMTTASLGDNMLILSITLPKDVTEKNSGVTWLRDTISQMKADPTYGYSNTTYVTGTVALTYDTSVAAMNDVKKIDPFSILLVLVLIGLFFRSLISAATPPLTIGVAYAVVLMAVFGIAMIADVFYITTTLVLISMLGAGCDYCIFIIARYREERKLGKNQDDSLKQAIMWAGESVTISGLCVIIGFGVMSLCSFSLVKTMGLVLAVGIIFALLAALTLIPSIVHLVGDKIFWPTKVEDYQEGSKVTQGWYGKIGRIGQRYFRSSAKFSIKHAGVILVAAIIITVPLTYVALTEKTSFDMVSTMPDMESKKGIQAITDSGAGGMTMPTQELLELQYSDLGVFTTIKDSAGNEYPVIKWKDDTYIEVEIDGEKVNMPLYSYLMLSTWYLKKDIGSLSVSLEPLGVGKAIMSKNNDNISMMMGLMDWQTFVVAIQDIIGSEFGFRPSYDKAEDMAIVAMAFISEDLADSLSDIKINHFPGDENINNRSMIYNYYINKALGSISEQHYIDAEKTKLEDPNQYVKMTIMFKDQPMSDKSMDTAVLVREACHEYQNTEEGKKILKNTYTTGTTASLYDISEQVQSDFKIIEIVVILLIIILLMLVMKSYFTPIRSVVTIIMSILWTLGITHLLFGHALGMPIIWLVPIVLFVVCLGLGMDYDVLLTTRIKEYVGRGMDNDTAIAEAVEHSGAIITICGLIMGGAFMSMVLSTTPMLQQFGFALGFAILVDALVIRTYVVPAVMHLMGKWNWIGPKFRYREQIEKEHQSQEQQQ